MEQLLSYFGHDATLPEFRKGLVAWADYILPILGDPAPLGKGGRADAKELNWDRYRESYMTFWPSRTVLVIPTLLYAYRATKNDVYKKAAVMMIDDLYKLQNANPLGHWNCWGFTPNKAGRDYDTVYLGATLDRGLWDFYIQKQLQLVGREKMSRLVVALCRSTLVGHKFADNGETDNFTAEATYHGGHPQTRVHAFLLLQDDFDFYKGLVGDMIRWGALAPERTDGAAYRWLSTNRMFVAHGPGSPIMLPMMWALGVYTGEHPQQGRLQVLNRGWRGLVKNAIPGSHAPLSVTRGDLKPELRKTNRPLSQQAVWRVTVLEPTYRTYARVEVEAGDQQEALRVSHRTLAFVVPERLHADWTDAGRVQVVREQEAGKATPVEVTVREGGLVFTAERGATYRLSYR
jgi:hypothetical protein